MREYKQGEIIQQYGGELVKDTATEDGPYRISLGNGFAVDSEYRGNESRYDSDTRGEREARRRREAKDVDMYEA